ncbi:TNF receptor-associated factor 5-like [Halichondria panicea]|uniref:TNF receptor-associated factor 5-like n=1 Tax=Halichondria panicea TaxID=6063 RepID=UPI00312B4A6D
MASPVNYEFVDKVPEDHQCTLCTNILTDPVLTGCCGQPFCNGCLKNWLKKQRTCPHCQNANSRFIKDLQMKQAIDSLKIYCPNRSKGCDKITTLSECNQHLEKCLFVEVSCTKKCGERMLRKELQDHEDNCLNRLVKCKYCNTEGMHKEITANSHIDKCQLFPIFCPNSCGHEKIQRKKLADHQKVCPLEPVKCPFFEAGCTELIPRKDLAAHKASNTEHHLELMMIHTVQKATKLEQLSRKFNGLTYCVTKQLGIIDSNPQNTQAAVKNIKSSLETMTTMLAPGDTRYYLPLVKESEYKARSASFYIKPGYKMYVSIDGQDNCTVYLEKGEYDHQLKWPMPEMEIELRTKENKILYRATICTECGRAVNRLEGDRTKQDITNPARETLETFGTPINPQRATLDEYAALEVVRDFVFLMVTEHLCKRYKPL